MNDFEGQYFTSKETDCKLPKVGQILRITATLG